MDFIISPSKKPDPYFQFYDREKIPDMAAYLEKRFEPQLRWYHNKARDNMYRFHVFQVLIIAVGTLIPVINILNFPSDNIVRIVSSVLASIVIGITGLLQLTKAQESWILFRSTAEGLKREYHLYMQKAGDYSDSKLRDDDDARNKLFIDRAESIFSTETARYFTIREQSSSTKTTG